MFPTSVASMKKASFPEGFLWGTAPDDSRRIEYVRRALQGGQRALDARIDVCGYTYWTALDNAHQVGSIGLE